MGPGPVSGPIIADGPEESDERSRLPFNIVAIGASAGGLQAYIELFDHLPANTGMAYIAVSHLHSEQESHLAGILARHTAMPVRTVENGMRLEQDTVYVVPPNAQPSIEGGVLRLEVLDSVGKRLIDSFFFSLASDQKNRSIGIVLSGMDN